MMQNALPSVHQFVLADDGPTAIEYAAMLALIVVVCLAAIGLIGSNASATFNEIAGQLPTS